MVSFADVLFVVGTLVAVALCWLGYRSYREWDEPGVVPFAVFTVLIGLGGVGGGAVSLLTGPLNETTARWGQIAVLVLFVSTVPWALFGLQYTGRSVGFRWRTAVAFYLPVVSVVPVIGVSVFTETDVGFLGQILATLLLLYVIFLLGLVIYLLVQATARYGHLSWQQTSCVVAVPIVQFVFLNSALSPTIATPVGAAAVQILAYAIPVGLLGLALFRYDMFESTPAVGEIGERAIARETDDLVLVVDDDERVVKLNESAVDTLELSRRYSLGASLSALLDHDIETFRTQETATLETCDGTRLYDAQVSAITDQHDRELGAMVSLHDVTERELREQRLSVLNRVLRHNLRNRIEVIKAHTEVLENLDRETLSADSSHAETIAEAADDIAGLGKQARSIDRFVATSRAAERVDIAAVVRTTLEMLDADDRDVAVTRHLPESATVVTNREALRAALESALENALKYADGRVSVAVTEKLDYYEVTVVDDGPGVPDAELAAIEEGTETALQHGTGLGLWQLRWAVTTMGGELSFDTSTGTTVTIEIPITEE